MSGLEGGGQNYLSELHQMLTEFVKKKHAKVKKERKKKVN
jgi:hypothetical protein